MALDNDIRLNVRVLQNVVSDVQTQLMIASRPLVDNDMQQAVREATEKLADINIMLFELSGLVGAISHDAKRKFKITMDRGIVQSILSNLGGTDGTT